MDDNGSQKRPAKTTQITTNNNNRVGSSEWLVSILPSFLIMDILSRLPINTLFNCRSVCKTWNNLISSDKYFTQLQLTNSPSAIFIKTIRRHGESRQLQLAQITGGNTRARFGVEKMKFNSEDQLPNYEFHLVNSCNGLLCLSGHILIADQIYICNPILGEHITIQLPDDNADKWKCKRRFGFGFCAETNQYKVIQTFNIMRSTYQIVKNYQEAEIYTIGTGKWRSIGNPPCKISSTLPINSFLNGSIHWINSSNPDGFCLVYAFNFGNEQFVEIPLPSVLASSKGKKFMKVGVLRGCLCMSLSSAAKKSDIWIMKEYGIKESWTKLAVIENICLSKITYDFCEPIFAFDSENILMLCGNRVLACYNVKTKRFRDAKISQTNGEFHIVTHTPSFISVKHITDEEDIGISRHRHKIQAYEDEGMCSIC